MTEGVLKGARAILLISALVYPFVVVAIVVLTVRTDPFVMFRPNYWVLCFLALPVVWAFAAILWARSFGSLPKVWLVAHLVILGRVTFVHFWVMVQFAGGV